MSSVRRIIQRSHWANHRADERLSEFGTTETLSKKFLR